MSSILKGVANEKKGGSWNSQLAAQAYGISNWGRDLFEVTDDGHISVVPSEEGRMPIRISKIIERAEEFGVQLPLLIRFPEIIETRFRIFRDRFREAITSEDYRGTHRMIYPIKVNPQDCVVETYLGASKGQPTGIEVGSKAELIAAIHHLKGSRDAVVVCNGKKDSGFITVALRAKQLGLRTILVAETPGEFVLVLKIAERMGIDPILGLRLQIQAREDDSKDGSTAGTSAQFGLSIPELIDEVDYLKARGRLHLLEFLHFHNSTQTKDRFHLRESIAEVTRVYRALAEEGAPMKMLDVGGGVPVVGTGHPEPDCQDHPLDWLPEIIFRTVSGVLEGTGIPHPEIITESGRSILAHSTVLIFDTIARSGTPRAVENPLEADCKPLASLAETLARAHDSDSSRDLLKDAIYHCDTLIREFKKGTVSIRERAKGERMFHEIKRCIAIGNKKLREKLESEIADLEFVSMSIFRSIPDHWGLGEVFPISPISGLDQRPTRLVKFRDLTCDPDGIIEAFLWEGKGSFTLPLPDLQHTSPVGIFLVGAYQEIIGSCHNLFGTTNVVDAMSTDNSGGFKIQHSVTGSTVSDMLTWVNTPTSAVRDTLRSMADEALADGMIRPDERYDIIEEFEDSLGSYTYFQRSD